MLGRYPTRYSRAPWLLAQSDLEPQGKPEIRTSQREAHVLGLHVRDGQGGTLGLLGIRCEGETPISAGLSNDLPSAQGDGDMGDD